MEKILKVACIIGLLTCLFLLCLNIHFIVIHLKDLNTKLTNLEQAVATLEIKLEMTGVRSYFLWAPDSKEVYIEYKAVWEEHMRQLEQLRNSK